MKNLFSVLLPAFVLPLALASQAVAQQSPEEQVVADFENRDSIAGSKTSHEASVTVVDDVPEGGGRSAVKTAVASEADSDKCFSTGFAFRTTDFSGTDELRFWIKTDIEGSFSFQIQSGNGRASSFRFSTKGTSLETWQQFTAPVVKFTTPPWAKAGADWASVRRWQVTAYGSGPYDGKYIVLDNVVRVKKVEQGKPVDPNPTAGKVGHISLTKIGGRHWLVDPSGKPFFAHGITHVGNARAKIDFARISEACRKLGFNAYGYGCPEPLRSDMPYIESWNHLVPISTYRGDGSLSFVDIFDPEQQGRLEAGVKANCSRSRGNPNCIGYSWTDLGAWPLKNSTGRNWVEFIRSLPKNSPGQHAWSKFIGMWEGDDDKARDQAFLRLIAREYFRVIGEANRKFDPDHLIFGDRFAFNTLDPDVVKEMLPWVDAIAIQPPFQAGFPKKKYDEIHKLTGKPILLCDFAIRFKDGDKDIRGWKPEKNSVAAGKAYAEYVRAALDTNYIIGVFWCNPVDTPKGFSKPGVKQGFFGEGLTERPGLHQAVREVNTYRDQLTPKN